MAEFESFADRKTWQKGVRYLSKKDRTMARLLKKKIFEKIELHTHHYDAIVHSIIYQQISGAAGNSILRKFKGLYGGKLPKPSQFLATKEAKVRAAGISPQKYSYIKDLCEKIESGQLELKKFSRMPNDQIILELDDVRGIGRWTAEMFLMFSLGRTDVLPMDDLGIRNSIKRVYKLKALPEREFMSKLEEKWRPYNSIASLGLWFSHDNKEVK